MTHFLEQLQKDAKTANIDKLVFYGQREKVRNGW
jgi:hypothetical protein